MAKESLAPVLLVSMPQMLDPNFSKTVVLLAEYTANGAFGLVVNRRMDEPAMSIVTADEPLAIFAGGSEQVAGAAAVDADDLFCRRLGQCAQVVFVHGPSSLARRFVVTPIHMSRLRAGIA